MRLFIFIYLVILIIEHFEIKRHAKYKEWYQGYCRQIFYPHPEMICKYCGKHEPAKDLFAYFGKALNFNFHKPDYFFHSSCVKESNWWIKAEINAEEKRKF